MFKLVGFVFIMVALAESILAQSTNPIPKFMGRKVTLVDAGYKDEPGLFPKGPASVCVEGPPQRQCYTAKEDFGGEPTVSLVQVEKDMLALLFSAASGGVSGWAVHFALLRPGTGNNLEDLLVGDVTVSNQNQHAFVNDTSISPSPIFLIADAVWGPNEGHYGPHRFMVSAYARGISSDPDSDAYYLADQFMTVRRYDLQEHADIITSEKQEIVARLRRVKVEMERQAGQDR
jgi:hypothetical protein